MKPHIAPYRRHDRPGKWSCISQRADGYVYAGTGYSPAEAFEKWQAAVTCRKSPHRQRFHR